MHSNVGPSHTSEVHQSSSSGPYDQSKDQLSYKDETELKAALHNDHEVRVKVDGENLLVPKDAIDPTKVELECKDDKCYLVPDDGNPHNDIVPDQPPTSSNDPKATGTFTYHDPLANGYYALQNQNVS